MSHMELATRQGCYAPLKQQVLCESDTDSEDVHYITKAATSAGTRPKEIIETVIQVPELQPNSAKKPKPPKTLKLKLHHTTFNEAPSDNKQNNNRMAMIMSDITLNTDNNRHYNDNLCNLSSLNQENATFNLTTTGAPDDAPDHVAILGTDDPDSVNNRKWQHEPMSLLRRCCFLASCALCFITVITFIWIIPCNQYHYHCPADLDRIKTHNWLNNYTKIELIGGINIVSGARNWEKHLIFLYRGDVFFTSNNNHNNKRHGIISLIGSSGAVSWYNDMTAQPLAIDCSLLNIEINPDTPVCLLIDELGMLTALNAQTGNWYWHYKTSSSSPNIDLPLVLPDLDGDGVYELLLVSTIDNSKRNYLRILSGRQGRALGEGTRLHDCDALLQIQLESEQMLSYSCLRNRTELLHSKSLAELYALITNKSAVGVKQLPNRILRKMLQQQRLYNTNNHYNNNSNNSVSINHNNKHRHEPQRNVYTLSGRELLVENVGNCPENCNVTVVLSERPTIGLNKNSQIPKVLRNFTQYGMYGMVPVKWHFKDKLTGKTKMSGFVMKFWKWNLPQLQPNITKISKPTNNKNKSYNNSSGRKLNTTTDNEHEKYNKYNVSNIKPTKLDKRENSSSTIVDKNINVDYNNYKMQMITETVILVLFIGTETRIENTSQSSIVQFCRNTHNDNEINNSIGLICQPELNNQKNSMAIGDLDDDGSQELVTYMSTFVQTTDTSPSNWRLVTYVRLLRLQSELPAFYADNNKNK